MPRRDLPFQPGHYYHLYNRGNDRNPIFFERENYLHFLRLIRRYLIDQTLDVVAYCLMPNHYHLLVQCKTSAVSGAMMRLSVAYTFGLCGAAIGHLAEAGCCSAAVGV